MTERLGLSGKESSAAPYLRALVAFLKEAPGVGWAFKGTTEALKELSEIPDDQELEERFSELLAVGQQTSDQIQVLGDIAQAIFTHQVWLGEKLREAGLLTKPDRLTEFAKEATLVEYRSRVAAELRYADQRGVEGATRAAHVASLPFDDVFVVPRLVPERERTPTHEREKELLRNLLSELDTSSDQRVQLEEEYALLSGERWRLAAKGSHASVALGDGLKSARQVVIIGSPGVGKSTLSRFLARAAALGEDAMQERLGWGEPLTPVLVPLAAFAEARRTNCNLPLRAFIEARIAERGGEALRTAMADELSAGRVLVLLDGVDEVPESGARAAVVQAVDSFLADHGEARVVVTSRPYGYVRLRGELPHFTLPNFTVEQVEEFVSKWQRACELKQHPEAPNWERATAEAESLLNEIRRNPKVMELATNPLMLVIVSFIRYEKARLPEERVQLYSAAINTLMDTWNHWRSQLGRDAGGATLPLDRLVRVWGAVAEWTRRTRNTGVVHRAELRRELIRVLREREYDDEDPEATAEAYLRAAADRAGLLEERGPDIFSFWHPTFEEFLAAVDLATPTSKAAEELLAVADDPRWREVVILAVGYVGIIQRDPDTASEIVKRLLEESLPPTASILHGRLRLAAACLTSRTAVRRSVAEEVLLRLGSTLMETSYPELESVFAETVAALGLFRISPKAVSTFEALTTHGSPIVRRTAMLLLAGAAAEIQDARLFCERNISREDAAVSSIAALGLARTGMLNSMILRQLRRALTNFRSVVSAWIQQSQGRLESLLVNEDPKLRIRAAMLLAEARLVNSQVLEVLYCGLSDPEEEAEILPILLNSSEFGEKFVEVLVQNTMSGVQPKAAVSAMWLLGRGRLEGDLLMAVRSWFASEDKETRTVALLIISLSNAVDKFSDALFALLKTPEFRFLSANLLLRRPEYQEEVLKHIRTWLDNADPEERWQIAEIMLKNKVESEAKCIFCELLTCANAIASLQSAISLWKLGERNPEVIQAMKSGLLRQVIPLSAALWQVASVSQHDDSMTELLSEWALEENLIESHEISDFLLERKRAGLEIAERLITQLHPEPDIAVAVCRRVFQSIPLTHAEAEQISNLVRSRDSDSEQHRFARSWLHRWIRQQLEAAPLRRYQGQPRT